MKNPNVLIVDDEKAIRRLLRLGLESNGYQVEEATTGQEALTQAPVMMPDIVILDLGLPDMEGIDVLKRLREWSQKPVIVVSVRDTDEEKIVTLDAGANDYMTKPFSVGELLARIRAAQRQGQPANDALVFQSGALKVDLPHRQVTVNDQEVKLTATEYAVLLLFVQHPGKVLTHRQLLREVWGPEYTDETQYLRVYMAQLRRKLEADPSKPTLFLTEPGVGYRLAVRK